MSESTDSSTLERLKQVWEKARKERNLTQEQVSAVLGFKQSYFSQLIKGKKKPNLDVLFKLSLYFKIQPLDLAPDEFGPYADAFNAMLHQAQENYDDKDAIIKDLERRRTANIYSNQGKATENEDDTEDLTPNEKEVLDLLGQLPAYETELALQQLRARVGFIHGTGSQLTFSGLAATNAPAAHVMTVDPAKSKET